MEDECFFGRVLVDDESASSSVEASCEDGWSVTAAVLRFRFPEPVEEGEDILETRVLC